MKTFIFIIILAAFLQTAAIPVDLVLLLILSRSLITTDSLNLYLAFFAGILLGLLTPTNLGFYALFFIFISWVGQLLRKTPLISNILTILPISFIAVLALSLVLKLFQGESINLTHILVDTLLSLPIYIGVRFWEERFIVPTGIKLKMSR